MQLTGTTSPIIGVTRNVEGDMATDLPDSLIARIQMTAGTPHTTNMIVFF